MAREIAVPGTAETVDRAAVTREKITEAGTQLFAERGYAAASMRELADRAGVSLSASYYHFPGKHDVLVAIMRRAMDELEGGGMEVMEQDLAPLPQLAELIRAHVRFHLAKPDSARVGDAELRSLQPPALEQILAQRDRYEDLFRSTLAEGVQDKVFRSDLDIPVAAMVIITMSTSTIEWWKPVGRLSAEATADAISELGVAMVIRPGIST